MKILITVSLIFLIFMNGPKSEGKDITDFKDISILEWDDLNKIKDDLKVSMPNRQELSKKIIKLYKYFKPLIKPRNPHEILKASDLNMKHMYIAYILSEYPDLLDDQTRGEIYAHAKKILNSEKREIWSLALMTLSHVAKKSDISIFVQFAKKSNSLLEPTLFSLKAVCFHEALEALNKLEVYFSEPSKKRLVRQAIADWELVSLESRPWCGKR